MLGAIAEGETVIHGLLLGEDPRSTASCFRAMGVEISQLNSEKVIVKGRGLGNLEEPLEILDAGNSGTTIRLMLDYWLVIETVFLSSPVMLPCDRVPCPGW